MNKMLQIFCTNVVDTCNLQGHLQNAVHHPPQTVVDTHNLQGYLQNAVHESPQNVVDTCSLQGYLHDDVDTPPYNQVNTCNINCPIMLCGRHLAAVSSVADLKAEDPQSEMTNSSRRFGGSLRRDRRQSLLDWRCLRKVRSCCSECILLSAFVAHPRCRGFRQRLLPHTK